MYRPRGRTQQFYNTGSNPMPNILHKNLICPNCKKQFVVQPSFDYNAGGQRSFADYANRGNQRNIFNTAVSGGDNSSIKLAGRLPLLVSCGHSICEQCVHQSSSDTGVVTCGDCKELWAFGDPNIVKEIPVNYYYVGLLLMNSRDTIESKLRLTPAGMNRFNEFGLSNRNAIGIVPKNKVSCVECKRTADVRCVDCKNYPFCRQCDSRIHNCSVVLQEHNRVPIVPETEAESAQLDADLHKPPRCSTHGDRVTEFYCNTCDCVICHGCALISHKEHELIDVKDKNRQKFPELTELLDQVKKVLERLKSTQKKIERELTLNPDKPNSQSIQLEQSVTSHFALLHGRLQLQEKQLHDRLVTLQHECSLQLNALRQTVQADVARVSRIVAAAQSVVDKQNDNVDAGSLVERLRNELNTKCHLIGQKSDEDKIGSVEFIVDKAFIDMMDTHCRLQLPENHDPYHLISTADLPSDRPLSPLMSPDSSTVSTPTSGVVDVRLKDKLRGVMITHPNIPVQLCPYTQVRSPPHSESSESTISTNNSMRRHTNQSHCDKRYAAQQHSYHRGGATLNSQYPVVAGSPYQYQPQPAKVNYNNQVQYKQPYRAQQRPAMVQGAAIQVVVSHVKDPGCFYVQYAVDARKYIEFGKQYEQYASRASTPTAVNLNDMFLTQFDDKKWYRGQVKNIIKQDGDREVYEVFYIDFGNSQTVPIEKLRTISEAFVIEPPMAYRCAIFDLVPKEQEWTSVDTATMVRILNSGCDTRASPLTPRVTLLRANAILCVMGVAADRLYVDLLTSPKDAAEVPTSIRDAMIFLQHGTFVEKQKCQKSGAATITEELDSMKKRLKMQKKHHFRYRDIKKGSIQDVVVSCVKSPANFYVHLCNTAHDLYNLSTSMFDKYTTAGQSKGILYSPEIGQPCAVNYKSKWFRGLVLELPGNSNVEVQLVDYGNRITISWELLRKLHDEFMGLHVQAYQCQLSYVEPLNQSSWDNDAIDFFKEQVEQKTLRLQVNEVEKRDSCEDAKKVGSKHPVLLCTLLECLPTSDTNINALLVKENHANSTGVGSLIVNHARITTDTKSVAAESYTYVNIHSKTHRSNQVPQSTEPYKLPVKILLVKSPNCIYFSTDNRDLPQLQDDMFEYYEKAVPEEPIELTVGQKCAALSSVDKFWYRAIIEEVLPNSQVKVFIKDYARYEIVPVSALRQLLPRFLTVVDGAFKCHLYGIRPAGGKDEYPMLACETLQELVDKYPEMFVTKRGPAKDRSLPVDLWGKRTIRGGALEPNSEEWVFVNRVLLDKGLVIPTQDKEVPDDKGSTTAEFLSSLENSEFDVASTVNEWLEMSKARSTPTNQETTAIQTDTLVEWLPRSPVRKNTFEAIVTHVDDEMNIYLHDTEAENVLTAIMKTLNGHFKDSKPSSEDMYWLPNQLCIAKHNDDFYRGKVETIDDDGTITVLFCDYGFKKLLKAKDLRKNVLMGQKPLQAVHCQFFGLQPQETGWSEEVLEYVRDVILDKRVKVTVHDRDLIQNVLFVSIKIDNDDISENLVQSKWATRTESVSFAADSDASATVDSSLDESASMIDPEFDDEISKAVAFKPLRIPRDCNELEVNVVSSSTVYRVWYIQPTSKDGILLKNKCEYEQLFDEIQNEIESQLPLKNPQPGLPCCARYEEDKLWYRAEIKAPVHKNSDSLYVQFVDFGNTDIVCKSDVKEMRADWMKTPMQCLPCILWRVVVVDEGMEELKLIEDMGNVMFDLPLIMKVKDRSARDLQIELFDKNTNKLIYQKFIDNGILKIKD